MLLFLATFFVLFLIFGGRILIVSPGNTFADLGFVFLGDEVRISHIASLLKKNQIRKIAYVECSPLAMNKEAVNANNIEKSLFLDVFKSYGVPDTALVKISGLSLSTKEEVVFLSRFLQKHGTGQSITLVSSPYQSRRISIMANKFLNYEHRPYSIQFSYPEENRHNAYLWWNNSKTAKTVLSEYAKIIFYLTYDQFIEPK